MKILIATGIYPPEVGGPATYAKGMAAALRLRGHAVTVVAYGENDPRETSEGTSYTFRVSRSGGPVIRYLRYAWRVFRLARKFDLVYAMGPVSEGLPATVGAWFARRPLVMKMVGDYAWEMAQQSGEPTLLDEFLTRRHRGVIRFYEWAERWTSRRARLVIVPSRYLKTVVEKWGIKPERIQVVINAIEPLPITAGRDAERSALDVSDKTVILTVVRAVPWKGVGELIDWWKDLPSNYYFVIAGDGPELEKWKAAAAGLSDRVRFLGRTDRQTLASWYEAADAFVLNSGYEGYPHVVAEAASRGVPCLVSDQGGNPETKTTFGDLVNILPYQNRDVWIRAIGSVQKRTSAAVHPSPWTYEQMTDATESILTQTQTIMISYDRELSCSSSAAYQRVSDLARPDAIVKAIILSKASASADVTLAKAGVHPMDSRLRGNDNQASKIFQSIGWRGSKFSRMWRAFRYGVREAKRFSGQTVVTAQDPFVAGLVGYFISRFSNAPLEIQEHGDFYSGYWARESFTNRCLSILGRFLLMRAERVRCVSDRIKRHLVKIGVDEKKIEVITVAQDLGALFSRSVSVFPSVPTLAVPCRFVRQKGLDVLLDAAKILKDRGIPFKLALKGSGPLEAKIKEWIDARGLKNEMEVSGWQKTGSVWDNADLFVLSSRYEGWARTIVEAMAAGVPIVTTDVGCVGSFFRPNSDGLSIPVNNVNALADAIQKQITDSPNREKMRDAARIHAKEFPLQEDWHNRQRNGWCNLIASVKSHETGPRWDLWIAAFLAVAILSRAASVILFHASLLPNREWGFYTLVDSWLKGFGYSFAHQLGCASAYRSPGYLFFLSVLYTFFSPTNTLAQAIVQNVFVVGILWLVYAVGSKLVGKRAALVAGFLMACYPYTFYHYTQYYHTFLSSFFLLLLVWFLLKLKEIKYWRYAIGAGVSIGCLAYVQGTILPASPFIVLWLLWCWWPSSAEAMAGRPDWKRTLKAAVIMALLSAALIAPWTYRNWTVFHHFVPLTTDLGFAMAKANNENIYELTKRGYPQEVVDDVVVSSTDPGYIEYRIRPEITAELERDGVYQSSIFSTQWHPKDPTGMHEACSELGPANEYEFNAHWNAIALAWIKTNFWTEGWKLSLLKMKTFWQPSLFPSVKMGATWSFAGSSVKVWLARNAMTAACAVVIFGGWIGLLWTVIRKRKKEAFLPLAIILVYTVMHSFFAGYTKYRIPLDNLMAIYAGWTIVAVWDWLSGRRDKI